MAYALALYGTNAAAKEKAFNWSHVDVIYTSLLTGLNQTCFGQAQMIYRKPVIGATFVDYFERAKIDHGAVVNMGGPRASPRIRRWPWTEVLHSPRWGRGMVDEQLWMYVARGSGLWFHPGRVLELSDTYDLAIYLNATKEYHSRSVGSKAALLQIGERWALATSCSLRVLTFLKMPSLPFSRLQHWSGLLASSIVSLSGTMWMAAAATAW